METTESLRQGEGDGLSLAELTLVLPYRVLTAEYKRRSEETGEEVTAVSSPGGR